MLCGFVTGSGRTTLRELPPSGGAAAWTATLTAAAFTATQEEKIHRNGSTMRTASRCAMLLMALLLALPAAADKAHSLYEKGRDAEARQKYDEAYTFFRQAYDLKPRDT